MKHILLSLLLIATPISTNGNAIVKQQLVNNKRSISIDKAETQVKEFVKSISSQLTRTQLNAYENEINKILYNLKKKIIKVEDLQKDVILKSANYLNEYFKNNSFKKSFDEKFADLKLFSITYEKAQEYQNQLRKSYAIAVSVSTSSAIAAAGFWAIAWQVWPKV